MPYIKKERRYEIIYNDGAFEIKNPGELNWLITRFCVHYLNQQGKSYQTINDIIGVLECAKQEFYRRVAAPYENKKIEENGDVY